MGLYPAFREERAEEERRGAEGPLAVAGAALVTLRRNPAVLVHVRLDGREIVRKSALIVIANNEHRMQGYEIGTRARLDAGRLWIYIMRVESRTGLLRVFFRTVTGRLRRRGTFETLSARAAEINTGAARVRVSLDGAADGRLRTRGRGMGPHS